MKRRNFLVALPGLVAVGMAAVALPALAPVPPTVTFDASPYGFAPVQLKVGDVLTIVKNRDVEHLVVTDVCGATREWQQHRRREDGTWWPLTYPRLDVGDTLTVTAQVVIT
jgi:hypothetical protein